MLGFMHIAAPQYRCGVLLCSSAARWVPFDHSADSFRHCAVVQNDRISLLVCRSNHLQRLVDGVFTIGLSSEWAISGNKDCSTRNIFTRSCAQPPGTDSGTVLIFHLRTAPENRTPSPLFRVVPSTVQMRAFAELIPAGRDAVR